jgi:hypothetical protein
MSVRFVLLAALVALCAVGVSANIVVNSYQDAKCAGRANTDPNTFASGTCGQLDNGSRKVTCATDGSITVETWFNSASCTGDAQKSTVTAPAGSTADTCFGASNQFFKVACSTKAAAAVTMTQSQDTTCAGRKNTIGFVGDSTGVYCGKDKDGEYSATFCNADGTMASQVGYGPDATCAAANAASLHMVKTGTCMVQKRNDDTSIMRSQQFTCPPAGTTGPAPQFASFPTDGWATLYTCDDIKCGSNCHTEQARRLDFCETLTADAANPQYAYSKKTRCSSAGTFGGEVTYQGRTCAGTIVQVSGSPTGAGTAGACTPSENRADNNASRAFGYNYFTCGAGAATVAAADIPAIIQYSFGGAMDCKATYVQMQAFASNQCTPDGAKVTSNGTHVMLQGYGTQSGPDGTCVDANKAQLRVFQTSVCIDGTLWTAPGAPAIDPASGIGGPGGPASLNPDSIVATGSAPVAAQAVMALVAALFVLAVGVTQRF